MRFDHDHRHAALSQPDRGRDASNAATGHDDRPGPIGMPHPAPPDDGLHGIPPGQRASRRPMIMKLPTACAPERCAESSLPARRRADLDVDESRTVQTIDKGLDRVEGPHAATGSDRAESAEMSANQEE